MLEKRDDGMDLIMQIIGVRCNEAREVFNMQAISRQSRAPPLSLPPNPRAPMHAFLALHV
jgi:hypothetical protein